MNKKTKITIIILIAVCFIVCLFFVLNKNKSDDLLTREIFAMDTVMDITIYGDDDEKNSAVMKQMTDEVYSLEKKLSVTIAGSDIYKLNNSEGAEIIVSDETYELMESAKKIAEETDGFFDPSIYPIVKLWGFTTDIQRVPKDSEIKELLKSVDYHNIRLLSDNKISLLGGTKVDLGACAKGYLSDRLCEILRAKGLSGIVSLGGNVQSVGLKPDGSAFKVGITDPEDGAGLYTTIESSDEAVITSGDYQRFFTENGKKYHHIFDVKSGYPAQTGIASVTVRGKSGLYCDAYATAMYVMGADRALEFIASCDGYEALIIDHDGKSVSSDGW